MIDTGSLGMIEMDALRLSLKVGLTAAVVGLVPAVVMAWILARLDFFGKSLIDSVIHLPLVLPPVAVGYGLLLLAGPDGVVGSWLSAAFGLNLSLGWLGAVVAATVMAFPLFVRAARQAFEAVDPRLEELASTLGCGRWQVFRRISLPLALPGVVAGMLLAFARAFGEFGATLTLIAVIGGNNRTLPLALRELTQSPDGAEAALRLCLLSVVVALGALLISEWLSRRVRKRMEARS
ncbi:molybdate ABC transporter permease subunit [Magnetospira sp. QH-2]|uniref:molybdate ABC transporter permease subunit n=1 Tax=Magnetospira sp. (strain QH-2) TaxID=1288970 RepID=UPI0003E81B4F|nr:molybdate ABC transporter permease subunit [Magnetospira sp. QH-2]CCQ73128.1 Molybdenum transport system permease protein modB [Magnetospira sp. QH-2]